MNSLSVIIITKNAEADLERCLQSVAWANEIIVLDSGSLDRTVEIARNFTDHVYSTDWPGFGPQKNRALDKASQTWVLSLDADEWLSDELQTEVRSLLSSHPTFDAYEIPRLSSFLGEWIHHGSWKNDKVLRLFKRGKAVFSPDTVHERLICQGSIGQLKGVLLHHPFKTLDQVIQKMNAYSSYSAEAKVKRHKKGGLLKAILHGVWMFCRCYFLKAGFLDGKRGFILAVSNAEGSYYRYLKMRFDFNATD